MRRQTFLICGARQSQELVCREDLNTPERTEYEKIRIASDDTERVSTYSEIKYLVVLGIATRLDSRGRLDPLCLPCKGCQEFTDIFLVDILTKLLPTQNLVEFSE